MTTPLLWAVGKLGHCSDCEELRRHASTSLRRTVFGEAAERLLLAAALALEAPARGSASPPRSAARCPHGARRRCWAPRGPRSSARGRRRAEQPPRAPRCVAAHCAAARRRRSRPPAVDESLGEAIGQALPLSGKAETFSATSCLKMSSLRAQDMKLIDLFRQKHFRERGTGIFTAEHVPPGQKMHEAAHREVQQVHLRAWQSVASHFQVPRLATLPSNNPAAFAVLPLSVSSRVPRRRRWATRCRASSLGFKQVFDERREQFSWPLWVLKASLQKKNTYWPATDGSPNPKSILYYLILTSSYIGTLVGGSCVRPSSAPRA